MVGNRAPTSLERCCVPVHQYDHMSHVTCHMSHVTCDTCPHVCVCVWWWCGDSMSSLCVQYRRACDFSKHLFQLLPQLQQSHSKEMSRGCGRGAACGGGAAGRRARAQGRLISCGGRSLCTTLHCFHHKPVAVPCFR